MTYDKYMLRVPNLDKWGIEKQSVLPSEPKSSSRHKADWTCSVPLINDLQDSDGE